MPVGSSDPSARRPRALALLALGAALAALQGTGRFEALAEVASSPTFRGGFAQASDAPLAHYQPWSRSARAVENGCYSRDSGYSAHYHSTFSECRWILGPLVVFSVSTSSGGHGNDSSETVALDALPAGGAPPSCELSASHSDGPEVPAEFRRPWQRSGELLYAHDGPRGLHGYRCVSTTAGASTVQWTYLVRSPEPWRVAVWERSRPLVPSLRGVAAALLLAAAAVARAWLLRERVFERSWREARRGADGVLRLGEVTVRAPGHDGDAAVCVVVPDGAETATYRSAAEVVATHHRAGTLDALRAQRQRWRRYGVGAVVSLSAASVAASAALLATLQR